LGLEKYKAKKEEKMEAWNCLKKEEKTYVCFHCKELKAPSHFSYMAIYIYI